MAVISLTQGVAKPYVVRQKGSEEIFVRIGSVSRKASREQQARLFAVGGMLHTELLPVSGTGLDDLDMDRLQDYLQQVIHDPEVPGDGEAWERRLCGMGFLAERDGGKPRVYDGRNRAVRASSAPRAAPGGCTLDGL